MYVEYDVKWKGNFITVIFFMSLSIYSILTKNNLDDILNLSELVPVFFLDPSEFII